MTYKKLMSLSNEDLAERFQSTRSDKGAILGILYFNNNGLIKQIAKKYAAYESEEDLTQEAFFGLQTAAELYDRNKEAAFSTYAVIWIRQAIRRYIANCGSCVRMPEYKRGQNYQYEKILNRYLVEFGREPTTPELAKLLNVSEEQARELKEGKSRLRLISLDAPISQDNDEEWTLSDTIPGKSDPEAETVEALYNDQISLLLWEQVEQLEAAERDIIKVRYTDNLTVKEAADKIGCTEQAARSAEAKAMRALRKNEHIRRLREEYTSALAYHHLSVNTFNRTNTSITEQAALKRVK